MGQISEILSRAQQRGKEMNLSYAGALLPDEAYQLTQLAPSAKLVDVRSRAEHDFVGVIPDAVLIEWASYPGMRNNPNFMAELEQQVDKEALVMFICRSGARSHNAAVAATKAGYTECYNVLEGFEGDLDNEGHRNVLNGWRACGLPWEQT
jgi:rhodanese-related sulfurtransferase